MKVQHVDSSCETEGNRRAKVGLVRVNAELTLVDGIDQGNIKYILFDMAFEMRSKSNATRKI